MVAFPIYRELEKCPGRAKSCLRILKAVGVNPWSSDPGKAGKSLQIRVGAVTSLGLLQPGGDSGTPPAPWGPSGSFPRSSDEPQRIFWGAGVRSVLVSWSVPAGTGCPDTILGFKSPRFGACGCVVPQRDKSIGWDPNPPRLSFPEVLDLP